MKTIEYTAKIPLLARIFGQKQSTKFKDNGIITEIFSIIYRGNIYITKENKEETE